MVYIYRKPRVSFYNCVGRLGGVSGDNEGLSRDKAYRKRNEFLLYDTGLETVVKCPLCDALIYQKRLEKHLRRCPKRLRQHD